jgi:deoxyribonuclease V
MDIVPPARWPVTEADALAVQEELRSLVELDVPGPRQPRTMAGLDVAYADGSDRLAAAAVVLDTDTLEVVDHATATGVATFPYIPGLFAFRELPVLIEALRAVTVPPEVLVCDGFGIAHPRRFGLACHLGLLSGLPTFGVGKNAFVGTFDQPGPDRGNATPLRLDGEVVGRVLRTRRGVKPVFVSVGHRIDLDTACALVLATAPHYRLPETIRRADQLSRAALAEHRRPGGVR